MWERCGIGISIRKKILIRKRQASIFIKWFNKETVHRCQHKHTHIHITQLAHHLSHHHLSLLLYITSRIDAAHELLHVLSLAAQRKLSCCASLSLSLSLSLWYRKRRPLKILARKRKQEEQEGGGWCKSTKVSRAWDHSCQCWVPARVPLFPFCSLFLSLQKTPAGVYISPPCFVPHLLQLKGKEKR